jgi:hypothetical protein
MGRRSRQRRHKPIAANDGRALAAKLRVFARLVEESDGSEFAERERAMAAAIVKDVALKR